MRIEIEVDASSFQEVMAKLLAATNTTEILDDSSALILNKIRTRFRSKVGPDGIPWIPSAAGLKREAKGRPGTLWDTGNLFRSIQSAGTGPDERAILTDVKYARYHDSGASPFPQRKFMGFNDDDASLIVGLVRKRIKDSGL